MLAALAFWAWHEEGVDGARAEPAAMAARARSVGPAGPVEEGARTAAAETSPRTSAAAAPGRKDPDSAILVTFRVLDETGEPVAGVSLRVRPVSGLEQEDHDTDSRALLSPVRVSSTKEGGIQVRLGGLEKARALHERMIERMRERLGRSRAHDDGGGSTVREALQRKLAALQDQYATKEEFWEAVSDADGEARIALPRGRYELTVAGPYTLLSTRPRRREDPPSSGDSGFLLFDVSRQGGDSVLVRLASALVRGRLVFVAAPTGPVRVELLASISAEAVDDTRIPEQEVVASPDGRFEFRGVASGRKVLAARVESEEGPDLRIDFYRLAVEVRPSQVVDVGDVLPLVGNVLELRSRFVDEGGRPIDPATRLPSERLPLRAPSSVVFLPEGPEPTLFWSDDPELQVGRTVRFHGLPTGRYIVHYYLPGEDVPLEEKPSSRVRIESLGAARVAVPGRATLDVTLRFLRRVRVRLVPPPKVGWFPCQVAVIHRDGLLGYPAGIQRDYLVREGALATEFWLPTGLAAAVAAPRTYVFAPPSMDSEATATPRRGWFALTVFEVPGGADGPPLEVVLPLRRATWLEIPPSWRERGRREGVGGGALVNFSLFGVEPDFGPAAPSVGGFLLSEETAAGGLLFPGLPPRTSVVIRKGRLVRRLETAEAGRPTPWNP